MIVNSLVEMPLSQSQCELTVEPSLPIELLSSEQSSTSTSLSESIVWSLVIIALNFFGDGAVAVAAGAGAGSSVQ